MTDVYDGITAILGIGEEPADLGSLQLIARAVMLYLTTLVVIRLARSPFFGESVALDVVLGFILGSMLSRALHGDETLFHTVTVAGVMLVVHWLVRFSGTRGAAPPERAAFVADESVELGANSTLEPMAPAGALIALPQRTEPRVLEVQVADGVQTVRIAIG